MSLWLSIFPNYFIFNLRHCARIGNRKIIIYIFCSLRTYIFILWKNTFSNTMLNRSGESGHPCLVPDLSGKAFSFCQLSMVFIVGLSYMAFIMLRYASSIPTLLSVFIINRSCTLSNVFPTSVDMIMWFLSFL